MAITTTFRANAMKTLIFNLVPMAFKPNLANNRLV
jgi:hypothetical protein